MTTKNITERLAANERISERNSAYMKKLANKYQRVFSSTDGIEILNDLKRAVGAYEDIDLDPSLPFSQTRYFVRQGFRQAIHHINARVAEGTPKEEGDE